MTSFEPSYRYLNRIGFQDQDYSMHYLDIPLTVGVTGEYGFFALGLQYSANLSYSDNVITGKDLNYLAGVMEFKLSKTFTSPLENGLLDYYIKVSYGITKQEFYSVIYPNDLISLRPFAIEAVIRVNLAELFNSSGYPKRR